MSDVIKKISKHLRKRGVDEFFYPGISMDLDLPNGLKGEISEIAELLNKNGFKVSAENVFEVMEFKRELILWYTRTSEGQRVLEEYNDLLLKHVKPVGVSIPLELILVTGLVSLVLFVGARFLGSFANEAGKIVARKLLDNDKELSKEHNMTIKEYQFLKNQVVILIENLNNIDSLIEKLQKKKNES